MFVKVYWPDERVLVEDEGALAERKRRVEAKRENEWGEMRLQRKSAHFQGVDTEHSEINPLVSYVKKFETKWFHCVECVRESSVCFYVDLSMTVRCFATHMAEMSVFMRIFRGISS